MGPLRHLITLVVLAIVFRWLWMSSRGERASFEAGRAIFPAARAIRVLMIFFGIAFTSAFLWSWFAARKPDEWWVPYLFLGFLALVPFMKPPVLSIEVDGVGSRYWLAREEKKVRWEEIASLHYNSGSKQFVVRAKDGRKITHGSFNVDQAQFLHEVQQRTRLPLKLTQPGTWKSETFDVPFEES